jgi:hypothetical protein
MRDAIRAMISIGYLGLSSVGRGLLILALPILFIITKGFRRHPR